ncbi:MAG: helix-turn-helix domain-containing protein [Candidatus Woesearchaeota archaeon]
MNKDCTVYKTADFIGKKWTIPLILELYKGEDHSKRYSELKRDLLKITPKILSARLKELEKEELISKDVDSTTFPPRCTYSLTKSGKDFIPVIQGIKTWSLRWKDSDKVCKSTDCFKCEL